VEWDEGYGVWGFLLADSVGMTS